MKNKVNEIQIRYKERIKSPFWKKVNSSRDAADLLYHHWNKNDIHVYETAKILLLNNANKVKGMYQLSNGGLTGTLIDIRLIFAVVLKSLSTAIVVAHNHPSGTLKPSKGDRDVTQKIKNAAQLLDITFLDHLIITPNGEYYSFADNGMLWPDSTTMIYLNYNNLDGETQEKLLRRFKVDVDRKHGKELRTYAESNQLDFDIVLEEEAIKNLYTYKFIFTV